MKARLILTVAALFVLHGCTSMKPEEFESATPQFFLEEYFAGETQAWGLFEDRFGRLRRQFTVDIVGEWDGETLILDERFRYSDGETERRVWEITKTGPHSYEGRADDVVGVARGEAYGNALNWQYEMDLNVGDGTMRVRFNDWMFLQPSGVLLNRARVSKFGIDIGQVTVAFIKGATRPAENADPFTGPRSADVSVTTASR